MTEALRACQMPLPSSANALQQFQQLKHASGQVHHAQHADRQHCVACEISVSPITKHMLDRHASQSPCKTCQNKTIKICFVLYGCLFSIILIEGTRQVPIVDDMCTDTFVRKGKQKPLPLQDTTCQLLQKCCVDASEPVPVFEARPKRS